MVPVLLLTGFLGSGKTTLLNRLLDLRAAEAGRIAIVVNEFGDVGIDGDLLPAGMTRQVELPGGCICCVLNEDLDRTLLDLLAGESELELIIIETTGIAEPLPISWSLSREPLSSHLRLAAIATVVDALGHSDNRALSPSVDAQVEYADILAMSKLDLVDDQTAGTVVAALREQNPHAPVLLGTPAENAHSLWQSLVDPGASPARELVSSAVHTIDVGSGHHHHHTFDTVALSIEHTLDFEELAAELEKLPANYVRIKGIARVIDASTGSQVPHFIAFHRVGARVSAEPLAGEPDGRVVALGPGVDPAPLAACLEAAVVT